MGDVQGIEPLVEQQFLAIVVQRWDPRYRRLIDALDPRYLETEVYGWFAVRLKSYLKEMGVPPPFEWVDLAILRDFNDPEKLAEHRRAIYYLYTIPVTWGDHAVIEFRHYLAWRVNSEGLAQAKAGYAKRRRMDLALDVCQRASERARALLLDPTYTDLAKAFPGREAAWQREHDDPGMLHRLETGIAALDPQLRMEEGTVTAFLAPFKRYKSIVLNHMAVSALVSGYNVAHVIYENSKEQTLDRYFARLGCVFLDDLVNLAVVDKDPERYRIAKGFIEGLDTHLRNRVKIIEAVPKQTTVADVEAQLDVLAAEEHFIPDVTIWDYANLIGVPKETRDREERINQEQVLWDLQAHAKDKKGGGARPKIVVTAAQAKSEAIKAEVLDASHFGKSIGIPQALDCMIGIDQTRQERDDRFLRFNVIISRNAKIGDVVQVSCDISWMCIANETWAWVRERAMARFERALG